MSQVENSFARFSRLAWWAVFYNVLVILWGAGVRATGSGAGCGDHYPLCNGVVVPRDWATETFIEFTHRVTSGLALVLVLVLLASALKLSKVVSRAATRVGEHDAPHTVLKARSVLYASGAAVFFTLTEAAIGAGLVVFELVADNSSVARAAMLGVHLINTFLLLGALTLAAWWSSAMSRGVTLNGEPVADKKTRALYGGMLAMTLLLGASGAVAALGDTLFPVKSLREGLNNDLTGAGHFLVQLRVLHPILAGIAGLTIVATAWHSYTRTTSRTAHQAARVVVLLLCLEVLAGGVNVLLLAPVWMQIIHLLLADALWICLVVMTAATLESLAPQVSIRRIENVVVNA